MPNEVPGIVYQYLAEPSPMDENPRRVVTEKILSEKRIKVSHPARLNDPLDMIPALKPKISYGEAFSHVSREAERHGDISSDLGPIAKKFQAEWNAGRFSDFRDFARNLRSRLLCVTEKKDGVMMWSHYASRHAGFVVGFKSELLLANAGSNLFPVSYENERALCGPLDFLIQPVRGGTNKYGLAEKVFSQKSKEWEYEKEWRSIIASTSLEGKKFLPFPAEAVCELILGADMSESTELIVKNALAAGGFGPDIKLFRGRYCTVEYKIHIDAATWRM